MTLRGKVQGGVIVLDGDEQLPEGLVVEVHAGPFKGNESEASTAETGRTLSESYASFIGITPDLPPDAALNHDHYLYGCPKK